jgi:hypothetical protein
MSPSGHSRPRSSEHPKATALRSAGKCRDGPKGDIALENEGGRPTGAHHEFLSPLQFHPAHEITFSEQRALVAENVVSRGRMEKEVRQRERHQEAFCCEQKRVFARFAPESKDYAARPTSPFRAKLNPNVGKMNTEAAAARDAKLKPILEAMWEMPYREIAQELTNRKIPTPRGGDLWNAMTVMRAMKRLGIAGK